MRPSNQEIYPRRAPSGLDSGKKTLAKWFLNLFISRLFLIIDIGNLAEKAPTFSITGVMDVFHSCDPVWPMPGLAKNIRGERVQVVTGHICLWNVPITMATIFPFHDEWL